MGMITADGETVRDLMLPSSASFTVAVIIANAAIILEAFDADKAAPVVAEVEDANCGAKGDENDHIDRGYVAT